MPNTTFEGFIGDEVLKRKSKVVGVYRPGSDNFRAFSIQGTLR